MPVLRSSDAVVHRLHGAQFSSYAAPARGSRELCAWRLEVPAGADGVAHTVSREEVLLVLTGTLRVTLSPAGAEPGAETATDAAPGDVILVPAGASLAVGNPTAGPATAWVTTSVGLQAVLGDGSAISPPWVR